MTSVDSGSASTGPYLGLVEYFCRHHQLPFADISVLRGVPDDYESQDRQILPRLFEAAGFKSEFARRTVASIDPMVLPCVCFDIDGQPLVVVDLDSDNKQVGFLDPTQDSTTQNLKFSTFQKKIGKEILLVSPSADENTSRTEDGAQQERAGRPHWLWHPVRQNWSSWAQIVVAALGINLFGLALPIFIMNVYDRVIPNLAFVTLWTLAFGVAIALTLDMLLRVMRTNILALAGRRIDMKVAASLFQHAMNVRLLDRKGGAAGIASQIRDFEAVREFFTSGSFVAVIDLLFIGIFIFVLWIIVGPIAIVPLLAVPVVIIIALLAQAPIGSTIEKAQSLSAKRQLVLIESLLGIETVKSVNGEPVLQREWENAVAASSRISGKTRFWSTFAASSTALIQQFVSVSIVVWGVYLVSQGQITIGGLIAANILAGRVLGPLGNISQTLVRAQQALKSMSAISDFMQLPVETRPGPQSVLTVQRGDVEFRNVMFTYPGAKVPALRNVNLKVKAGETVGIIGRVGSGKSTLGKMLAGLISPDRGLLLIDGHEIQHYDPSILRSGIGYQPQDPELFTGTIRENIVLGRPNASEAEIERALYYSGMDYFIAENPEGLNQFVGEKGSRLSGGQRQAISLARLLLLDQKLLYLDEPTNAMDKVTEATVVQRLHELKDEGVGLMICSHRNTLIHAVDRLIVMGKGRVIADGPTQEIVAQLSGNGGGAKKRVTSAKRSPVSKQVRK
ncbi:MAG: type I secretion system permease/ATPase [Rhizobiaceae bacterium]